MAWCNYFLLSSSSLNYGLSTFKSGHRRLLILTSPGHFVVLKTLVFLFKFNKFLFELQEYVDLYVDWLLNTSISEQFNAFLSGFDLVVSDSPVKYLFNYKELELLIRGSEVEDSLYILGCSV